MRTDVIILTLVLVLVSNVKGCRKTGLKARDATKSMVHSLIDKAFKVIPKTEEFEKVFDGNLEKLKERIIAEIKDELGFVIEEGPFNK
nr:hypothetical transcript [Hymenolepis microstoma]